jgi:hypothetical protein
MKNARYLEVDAEVRYWEDATINGSEDSEGTLIPFKNGDLWQPVIDLQEGKIVDWPEGTTADIHYKVCDQGEYWLLNEQKQRIAKWSGYYVPDAFLCQGGSGYGDYIIMNVNADGSIKSYEKPEIVETLWNPVEPSLEQNS